MKRVLLSGHHQIILKVMVDEYYFHIFGLTVILKLKYSLKKIKMQNCTYLCVTSSPKPSVKKLEIEKKIILY